MHPMMQSLFIGPSILLLLVSSACGADAETFAWNGWSCDQLTPDLCDLDVHEGTVSVRGVHVHYWKYSKRVVGARHMKDENENEHKNQREELPVIAINGGPSWAHNYMLPLKQLACRGNREVIFYDQAGCGASSVPDKAETDYPWLLDLSYYATEELPALISHLSLSKFHIIGHSWGTMIAQVYAVDGPEQGLQSIVLSGPISDGHLFAKSMWGEEGAHGGVSSMPPYFQNRIKAIESRGAFGSPEYEALDNAFLNMFLTRIQPFPDCLVDSLNGMNLDLYLRIFGPNDFAFGGTIKDYNVTGRLHEINVPVLLSNGEYDFVRPLLVDAIEQNLPIVERILFEKSAHNTMQDDAGALNNAVADFQRRVETSLSYKKEKFRARNDEWQTSLLAPVGKLPAKPSPHVHFILVAAASFVLGTTLGFSLNPNRRQGYQSIT